MDWSENIVKRICFRGDDRSPNGVLVVGNPLKGAFGNIFRDGFSSMDGDIVPVYGAADSGGPGDIKRGGVCVSTRFEVAPLFPLGTNQNTMVYVVFVERAYNTHARQALDMAAMMKDMVGVWDATPNRGLNVGIPARQAVDIAWPLFGDEIVAKRIPGEHVIAAVSCTRQTNGRQVIKSDWKAGIPYQLGHDILINPGCKVDSAYRGPALKFLAQMVRAGGGRTPPATSGIAPSTKA